MSGNIIYKNKTAFFKSWKALESERTVIGNCLVLKHKNGGCGKIREKNVASPRGNRIRTTFVYPHFRAECHSDFSTFSRQRCFPQKNFQNCFRWSRLPITWRLLDCISCRNWSTFVLGCNSLSFLSSWRWNLEVTCFSILFLRSDRCHWPGAQGEELNIDLSVVMRKKTNENSDKLAQNGSWVQSSRWWKERFCFLTYCVVQKIVGVKILSLKFTPWIQASTLQKGTTSKNFVIPLFKLSLTNSLWCVLWNISSARTKRF